MGIGEKMMSDPARNDMLVLVDGLDHEIGTATKHETHEKGLLHRAFSVVLVRDGSSGPELLLASRAADKYHSAGLWANSCCSHPRVGETLEDAVCRRVPDELGCNVSDLREITAFAYRAEFASGLCEYEYDHVFLGRCDGKLSPDPTEVGETRWVGIGDLATELTREPGKFAAWAPMVLTMAMSTLLGKR